MNQFLVGICIINLLTCSQENRDNTSYNVNKCIQIMRLIFWLFLWSSFLAGQDKS